MTTPPYGNQPYGAPPPYQPPPPKPKSKALGCFGIGCGGLVLLGIIGGIAAAVSGGGKSTSNSTVAAGPAAVTSAAAHTSTAAAAAKKKPAAPKAPVKPHVLLKVSGNGIKNTVKFTTGDDWTIHYTYDCTKFGAEGNFQVYVDYPTGDIPVNELGKKGSSSSTETGAGTHALKVASECTWTLTVTNG